MSTPEPALVWARFTRDPRQRESTPLRASDRDRAIATDVLADAYADGRLDQDEYDDRVTAAMAIKTLGEIPHLIDDLVPTVDKSTSASLARATSDEIHRQAVERYRSVRQHAVSTMLIPSIVTSVIWAVGGGGVGDRGFFWPIFVILGTGINLLRVLMAKREIIASAERKLEHKQRKALGRSEPPRRADDEPV